MTSWLDIFSIFKIFLVLFGSSFLFYMPLILFFGNKKNALTFTIPVSISVQIIFGYIFYCFGWTHQFPFIYFTLGLALNIFALLGLIKLKKLKDTFTCNQKRSTLWFFLLFFMTLVYSRFADSLRTIAPGEIDTFSHAKFILDLTTQGYLSNPQYAPGFHLFVYPLVFVTKLSEIYRFTGPILGMVVALSIFLLLRDLFRSSISKFLLLTVMCVPIFNQLILQQIGFFSTALSFVFFTVFLRIMFAENEEMKLSKFVLVYCLSTVALALTVPYLYVQFLPALLLVLLLVVCFKRYFDSLYVKRILILFLISLLGLITAFGHVYIQTKILQRSTGFPQMPLISTDDKEVVYSNSVTAPITTTQSGSNAPTQSVEKKFIERLLEKQIFTDYITPMYNIARNIFSVKNIRPLNDLLSLGAYLWIVLSLILTYVSVKIKNKRLFVIAAFSVLFGAATQLGILEIVTYRGRSGWYLMLLLQIGIVFLFDQFVPKKIKRETAVTLLLFLCAISLTIFSPPLYYRAYRTDAYEPIKLFTEEHPQSSIEIVTTDRQISLISNQITISPFKTASIGTKCVADTCFVIFEKNLLTLDPVLSQRALSIDKNFEIFNSEQSKLKENYSEVVSEIKIMPEFSHFKMYWQDDNVIIYQFTN